MRVATANRLIPSLRCTVREVISSELQPLVLDFARTSDVCKTRHELGIVCSLGVAVADIGRGKKIPHSGSPRWNIQPKPPSLER